MSTSIKCTVTEICELLFAKFKAALRKAAKRTIPMLWKAIAAILETFTSQECANYLRHCGYVSK